MTIENGLDTPDTKKLDDLVRSGTLHPQVTAYLRVTRAQSIGWMIHDKFIANLLRVSAPIVRRIKAAVAKLPGVRRVRYRTDRGREYDGLLIGDHAEGDGYDLVGWYDGDIYCPGLPPNMVEPVDIEALYPHPTSHSSPRRSRSRRHRPEAEPEEQKPEDRVTPGNAARRVQVAEIRERRPDLAPGCAVIDGILDHKNTPVTVHAAENVWQGPIRSDVGDFTVQEAYEAVSRVASAGKPLTAEWIARGIRAARRGA